MKKQLNLICVLIFFFVGLSLVPSIYSMGNAFVDGFKEGMSQAEEAHEQGTTNISAGILSPMTLSLWPKSLAATSDKLFNQKDQECIRLHISRHWSGRNPKMLELQDM